MGRRQPKKEKVHLLANHVFELLDLLVRQAVVRVNVPPRDHIGVGWGKPKINQRSGNRLEKCDDSKRGRGQGKGLPPQMIYEHVSLLLAARHDGKGCRMHEFMRRSAESNEHRGHDNSDEISDDAHAVAVHVSYRSRDPRRRTVTINLVGCGRRHTFPELFDVYDSHDITYEFGSNEADKRRDRATYEKKRRTEQWFWSGSPG